MDATAASTVPPAVFHVLKAIEATWIGRGVRDSSWLFPAIESVHMLGIVVLVGTSILLDLRLLGRGILRDRPTSEVAARALPFLWGSFAVMLLTGVLMFASKAEDCYESTSFKLKMAALLLVGVNAIVFQLGPYRRIAEWENAAVAPASARIAAWVSLTLWICIVIAGRGIAYW
jgi:hypothetical protein